MCLIDGIPYREAARELGIGYAALAKRVERTRTRLKHARDHREGDTAMITDFNDERLDARRDPEPRSRRCGPRRHPPQAPPRRVSPVAASCSPQRPASAPVSPGPMRPAPAYIVCFDARVDGAFSTGGGFSMVDPIGFCLDYGDYRDPAESTFDWGVDLQPHELVACRLADGVAGVFVRADGDCAANNAREWTSADVLIADQITDEWREWHIATFGEDPQPTIVRTPSQLVAP